MKALVGQSRSLEKRDCLGRTPLEFAIEHDHEGVIEILLEVGAHVNKRNASGKMVIHSLVENGYTDLVEKLVTLNNEEVMRRDIYRRSSLYYAICGGNLRMVQVLLKAGALNGVGHGGIKKIVGIAEQKDHKEIAELIRSNHLFLLFLRHQLREFIVNPLVRTNFSSI